MADEEGRSEITDEATEKTVVLIIDDDRSILRALKRFFKGKFDDVLVASHPDEAEKLLSANRITHIVCDCNLEEQVERGQRIGMIKFWSRTELFIPGGTDFELSVKPGDKVKAGQTVLGILRCGR